MQSNEFFVLLETAINNQASKLNAIELIVVSAEHNNRPLEPNARPTHWIALVCVGLRWIALGRVQWAQLNAWASTGATRVGRASRAAEQPNEPSSPTGLDRVGSSWLELDRVGSSWIRGEQRCCPELSARLVRGSPVEVGAHVALAPLASGSALRPPTRS